MKEDIIKLAREAGMERVIDVHKDGTRTIELPHPDLLERFAALVAKQEREACARLCEELDAMNWADFGEYASGYADEIRKRGKS